MDEQVTQLTNVPFGLTGADKKAAENRTDKPGSQIGSGEKINSPSFGEPFKNGFCYRLVRQREEILGGEVMIRLKITDVEDGGVADRAGIRSGDYLDSYDGEEIQSAEALLTAVDKPQGGKSRTLVLIRGERFIELKCDEGRLGAKVTKVNLDDVTYTEARSAYERERQSQLRAVAREVILTTAHSLDGYRTEVVEVITAECAFGMNIFRDFFAVVSDVFGGRSNATQKVLQDARKTCLNELRLEAARAGANAVIAIDLDYSEFSGSGKSMLFLVASGTAVRAQQNGA